MDNTLKQDIIAAHIAKLLRKTSETRQKVELRERQEEMSAFSGPQDGNYAEEPRFTFDIVQVTSVLDDDTFLAQRTIPTSLSSPGWVQDSEFSTKPLIITKFPGATLPSSGDIVSAFFTGTYGTNPPTARYAAALPKNQSYFRGWRMAGNAGSQSPNLPDNTTKSITDSGLGYSGVWQDNFGSGGDPLYYASHLNGSGQPSDDSGFSMGATGLVIGARAAGRPVRIDCQICLFNPNVIQFLNSIRLRLTGVDGLEVEHLQQGLEHATVSIAGENDSHNHEPILNWYRLQVGTTWVFGEGDIITPTIQQRSAAELDLQFDTHAVSEGRAERCWIMATVVG